MNARSIGEILATRRTHQPVRRNSYDVEDKRADVFRPVASTRNDGLRWRDSLLQAVKEWNIQNRVAGKGVILTGGYMRVLEAYLAQLDFKTGRLEPSLEVITRLAGCAKDTVVRALKKLRELGILNWVRRTMKTGKAPGEGPQVKQATNAYFFTAEAMPRRLAARLRELFDRKRLRARSDGAKTTREAQRNDLETRAREAEPGSNLWHLQKTLDRISSSIGQSASLIVGQNPLSSIKGGKD